MDEKYWYLKGCPLFEQLDDEQIARLEADSQIKTFERKSLVYLPHDQSDSMLLLISGRVRIYHITGEGKEALLAFIDPGEVFGELGVVGQQEREEFAETMEVSQIIKIPRQSISQLMQTQPTLTLEFTQMIALRRQRFERRLKSLMFQPNRDRLIHLLLELAERYGSPHEEGVILKIKLSHQELANLIGSTRETVTVVLGELQLEKLVKVQRRQLILKKMEALAQQIDAPPPSISSRREGK
ncbi:MULTISPECIES: Crp/Fnr family transcriptional regulator [Rubinisphaera]|uniref:Transcriptional regulator, Crp/Fnr family n=1 Tax=Rubinisphaera brasiliensis (strain ATCC 49424 / DSM 5305 / JCM 21570 / IAM 15109 / NBRC 103401 / IFAM 1448) TaxID=756272 RepID=F0SK66_RUBBR|nr:MULTISPECIES: Crp/Fnr family transcriptional regulator [Rubinisphaera]ADY59793.1 transcriptional regulator, Crp/Fnr family [Rubinisphaera brasiliensis DSM 5305]